METLKIIMYSYIEAPYHCVYGPQNITHENFTTKIVLRWSLLLEEYGPNIKYIKVHDKDAVDDLIRIPLISSDKT